MAQGNHTKESIADETTQWLFGNLKILWDMKEHTAPDRKAAANADFKLILATLAERTGFHPPT